MANAHMSIKEVLDAMNEVIARDGGLLQLADYDQEQAIVEVVYRNQPADDCEACAITPEMMQDFLLDGFRARDVEVSEVRVIGA
jgi:Fe-S cluster biogenesis protein NfuA